MSWGAVAVVVVVQVVLVVGMGRWLREQVRRKVDQMVARGCPFFDGVPEHLKEIDGRLNAVESQAGEAAVKAERASSYAAEAADKRAKQDKIDAAEPLRTRGFGRTF